MRITSSIEYATRLMTTLARAYGSAPLPTERLSESDNVPADYVSQILVKLRRAGLVTSHRGSAGGYALSRPPAEITLGAVVRGEDVIIAHHDTTVQADDHLILFLTDRRHMDAVEKLFQGSASFL